MTEYTPSQWLLINLASHYGLDKEVYDVRLEWGRKVLPKIKAAKTIKELKFNLLQEAANADVKEEFMACALAIWDVTQSGETNYVVGLDACNSGAQVLSALTRCTTGMLNTGLLNTGKRPDLYTVIYKHILAQDIELDLVRKTVKDAVVPHLYGSKAAPEAIFGNYYGNFLKACEKSMPGLEWARKVLIRAWNSGQDYHEYILPNGSVAHLVSTKKIEFSGNYKAFNYTLTPEIKAPKMRGEYGTSCLAANVTHSFDAWVLSELDARCNYNKATVEYALNAINRAIDEKPQNEADKHVKYLASVGISCNIASVAIIEFIRLDRLGGIDIEYLTKLKDILEDMLTHVPFETKDIHDEFGCHCNHVNRMRKHYNVIMTQAYCSTWLYDVIQMITGESFHKSQPALDNEVVHAILENDYSIC